MANRYWVGGSGTWNTTSTTNWSATSGGAGGASVPTAADSVFFDQAATYTVTISGSVTCLDLTVSGASGTPTFGGTSATVTISGNLTLKAGTVWNTTGSIIMNATTAKTVTTNNVFLYCNTFELNGIGGSWTLGSAFRLNNSNNPTFKLTAGTFSTSASNFSMSAIPTIEISANSNVKVLTLNGSTVTIPSFTNNSTGNFTFNRGTSTFNSLYSIAGTAITFYNVNANYGSYTDFTTGCTYNNLTITTPSYPGVSVKLSNATITGLLTITGSTSATTPWIRFRVLGPGTITAASVSLSYIDFQYITGAGAATWSGTSIGNFGGNTNISFNAAKTVYYVAATLGNFGSANWSTTSGGATAASNFPLPQDTVIIDNSSGTGTLTIEGDYAIGNFDFSTRTTSLAVAIASEGIHLIGNLTLSTAITSFSRVIGSATLHFGSLSTQTLTSNGKTINSSIAKVGTGTLILADNASFDSSGITFVFYGGTLNLNGKNLNLTCSTSTQACFIAYPQDTRTLTSGGGSISIYGIGCRYLPNNQLIYSDVCNLKIYGAAGVTAKIDNSTYNTNAKLLNIIPIGSGFTTEIGGSTYGDIAFNNLDCSSFTGTLLFNGYYGQFCYGNLLFSSGMTITDSSYAVIMSATSGTKTITTNGKQIAFPLEFNGSGGTWQFQDNATMVSTKTVTLTNGTIDLNGKTFTTGTSFTTASGTKNITFNGGTLSCPASFDNSNPTGFTTTAGTGTGKISMTSATSKTFTGGGSTYNCTLSNDGAGALSITGNNTFTSIANGVSPTTFTFQAGTTTTITNWLISGVLGSLVTIGSSTTSIFTLSKASDMVEANYLSISRSTATGGAIWFAGITSTDGGNNTGWLFQNPPYGNFMMLF